MTLSSWVENAFQALAIDERRKPFRPSVWQRSPHAGSQVLEQVWFAGAHSNVGGSYPDSGLSDITLLWMLAKVEACGLEIDRSRLASVENPQPSPFGTVYDSQTIWYKLVGLGDYIRPIGQGANEAVANTAVERSTNSSCQYQPSNLKAFLTTSPHSQVDVDILEKGRQMSKNTS